MRDEFSELFTEINKWHKKTPQDRRTIDNLRRHLASIKHELPLRNCAEKIGIQFLVGYLLTRKLKFILTPLVVDAFLCPTVMYIGIEEVGYEFFLAHFHEHPLLVEKIRKGLNKPLRLRVQPVYPADDNLMCWFFDPWETKAYTLRVNWGKQCAARVDEKVKSTSAFSVFAEYKGIEHPFSAEYQERAKQYIEYQNALTSA